LRFIFIKNARKLLVFRSTAAASKNIKCAAQITCDFAIHRRMLPKPRKRQFSSSVSASAPKKFVNRRQIWRDVPKIVNTRKSEK